MRSSISLITTKYQLSFILFLLVNFFFSIRYLSRISEFYFLIATGMTAVYAVLWFNRYRLLRWQTKLTFVNTLLLSTFVLLCYFIFKLIPVDSLDVDRWSVITEFWNTYFKGDYAYYAKSNVGNEPGPMPFYYILALPFYLINELGYFSALGIFAFVGVLKFSKITLAYRSMAILLVLSSIFYMWEVVCRSNIFLNATLVLFVIIAFLNTTKYSIRQNIFLGIAIGLVMSTRNVFILPFLIAGLFQLKSGRMKFEAAVTITIVAITTFAATFLPFIVNHWNDFVVMNPFIVQSSFLVPFEYTLLFIGLAIVAGLLCKSISDVYFYSGLVLFISIFIYFLYHILTASFKIAFFDAQADVSYFILSVPFLMFHFLSGASNHKTALAE